MRAVLIPFHKFDLHKLLIIVVNIRFLQILKLLTSHTRMRDVSTEWAEGVPAVLALKELLFHKAIVLLVDHNVLTHCAVYYMLLVVLVLGIYGVVDHILVVFCLDFWLKVNF